MYLLSNSAHCQLEPFAVLRAHRSHPRPLVRQRLTTYKHRLGSDGFAHSATSLDHSFTSTIWPCHQARYICVFPLSSVYITRALGNSIFKQDTTHLQVQVGCSRRSLLGYLRPTIGPPLPFLPPGRPPLPRLIANRSSLLTGIARAT